MQVRPVDLWVHQPYVEAAIIARGWTWGDLPAGVSTDSLCLLALQDDRVAWAEHALFERQQPGNPPWTVWPYQRESLRYHGPAIHRCGAAVGKTRDLIAITTHHMRFGVGDGLIAGGTDGALADIWLELMFQGKISPLLRSAIDWDETTTGPPYRRLVGLGGKAVHLRPASVPGRRAGAAFRGVHATAFVLVDEAALMTDPKHWSELWRGCEPSAVARVYSVPTGEPSEFERMAADAPPYDPEIHGDGRGSRTPVLFAWSQRQRPDWGPALLAQAITLYGGENTPGFRRNVDGETGEPTDSVFPRDLIEPCFEIIPEFRSIKAVRSGKQTRVVVERVVGVERVEILAEGIEERPIDEWLPELLARHCPVGPGAYVAGYDYGLTTDPAEILVSRVGERRTTSLRLQLVRHRSPAQARALVAVSRHFHGMAGGWGVDASAGAGIGVAEHAVSLAPELDRFSNFFFGSKVEVARDDEDRPISQTLKEVSTRALEDAFEAGTIALCPHPDLVRRLIAHRSVGAPSGSRRFVDLHDHLIDCLRLHELRLRGAVAEEYAAPIVISRSDASVLRELAW